MHYLVTYFPVKLLNGMLLCSAERVLTNCNNASHPDLIVRTRPVMGLSIPILKERNSLC